MGAQQCGRALHPGDPGSPRPAGKAPRPRPKPAFSAPSAPARRWVGPRRQTPRGARRGRGGCGNPLGSRRPLALVRGDPTADPALPRRLAAGPGLGSRPVSAGLPGRAPRRSDWIVHPDGCLPLRPQSWAESFPPLVTVERGNRWCPGSGAREESGPSRGPTGRLGPGQVSPRVRPGSASPTAQIRRTGRKGLWPATFGEITGFLLQVKLRKAFPTDPSHPSKHPQPSGYARQAELISPRCVHFICSLEGPYHFGFEFLVH